MFWAWRKGGQGFINALLKNRDARSTSFYDGYLKHKVQLENYKFAFCVIFPVITVGIFQLPGFYEWLVAEDDPLRDPYQMKINKDKHVLRSTEEIIMYRNKLKELKAERVARSAARKKEADAEAVAAAAGTSAGTLLPGGQGQSLSQSPESVAATATATAAAT